MWGPRPPLGKCADRVCEPQQQTPRPGLRRTDSAGRFNRPGAPPLPGEELESLRLETWMAAAAGPGATAVPRT